MDHNPKVMVELVSKTNVSNYLFIISLMYTVLLNISITKHNFINYITLYIIYYIKLCIIYFYFHYNLLKFIFTNGNYCIYRLSQTLGKHGYDKDVRNWMDSYHYSLILCSL